MILLTSLSLIIFLCLIAVKYTWFVKIPDMVISISLIISVFLSLYVVVDMIGDFVISLFKKYVKKR